MNHSRLKKVGAAITLAALISACSSDNPDEGSVSFSAVSGLAYDGYVAFGRVYHDINNNGRQDAFEPRAVTDQDGYFTRSSDGMINYCNLASADTLRRHCLETASSRGVLRVVGGYDLFTGQPFTGSLSMDASELSISGGNVLSPISSILSGLSASDRATLLASLSLTEDDVDDDILSEATVDSGTFGTIYRLHKIVVTMEEALVSTYSEIGDEGFPNAISDLIYRQLAQLILDGADLENLSAQEATLEANLTAEIESLYASAEETPPTAPDLNNTLRNSDAISSMIDGLFITPDSVNTTNVNRAFARAVEVVVEKVFDGDSNTEIDAAIAAAVGVTVDTTNYLTALEADNVDINALINDTFADIAAVDDTAQLTGADDFSTAPGNRLVFNANDSEATASIEVYFQGEALATTGAMSMCLTFNEQGSDEFDVEGEQISGTWTLFPGSTNSVLLDFDLLGSRQVLLTSRGGGDYGFAFAGTDPDYSSTDGLELITGNIPSSDADCQE